MDYDSAAVNGRADLDRRADHDNRGERPAGMLHPGDRLAYRGEQGGLHVQVVDRVAGKAKLGENADSGAGLVGRVHQVDGLPGVACRIGEVNARAGGGHPHETVRVKIVELGHACAYHPALRLSTDRLHTHR